MIKSNFSTLLSIFVFVILLVIANNIQSKLKKPIVRVSKQQTAVNIDSKVLSIISVGNQRLFSSLLWIQTLIESDIEHYKSKNLNSWMYLRFKTIADLTPLFYENYLYGGQYLSIIKDDDIGAKKIYQRGLKYYPDDYYLNYNTAFHYYYELYDLNNALKIYDKIKFSPEAPKFLPSLVARMKSQEGDLTEALELLLTTNNSTPENSPLKERLQQSIYSLRAEIDLNCLNKFFKNCNKKDFDGIPYKWSQKTKSYHAVKAWKPFRPYQKKKALKRGPNKQKSLN